MQKMIFAIITSIVMTMPIIGISVFVINVYLDPVTKKPPLFVLAIAGVSVVFFMASFFYIEITKPTLAEAIATFNDCERQWATERLQRGDPITWDTVSVIRAECSKLQKRAMDQATANAQQERLSALLQAID